MHAPPTRLRGALNSTSAPTSRPSAIQPPSTITSSPSTAPTSRTRRASAIHTHSTAYRRVTDRGTRQTGVRHAGRVQVHLWTITRRYVARIARITPATHTADNHSPPLSSFIDAERVKKVQSQLRSEQRALDREMRQIDQGSTKTKAEIKKLAKKGDVKNAKILAREVVRASKQKNRLAVSKARLNSIHMQLQHQLGKCHHPHRPSTRQSMLTLRHRYSHVQGDG